MPKSNKSRLGAVAAFRDALGRPVTRQVAQLGLQIGRLERQIARLGRQLGPLGRQVGHLRRQIGRRERAFAAKCARERCSIDFRTFC